MRQGCRWGEQWGEHVVATNWEAISYETIFLYDAASVPGPYIVEIKTATKALGHADLREAGSPS